MSNITIGGITFRSKAECLRYVKDILNSNPLNVILTGKTEAFLSDLITRHPECASKEGAGIHSFYIDRSPVGGRCFYLKRMDGTFTDFSYISCVSGNGKSLLQEWRQAAREAVTIHIESFRNSAYNKGSVFSSISGNLVPMHDSHVDHAAPKTFVMLSDLFLDTNGLTPSYEWLSKPCDNQAKCVITDMDIRNSWILFHNSNANLRIVSSNENLSILRRADGLRP